MKTWVIAIALGVFTACAHMPVVVNIKCPNPPAMLPVEVRDGKLDQQEVSHVIHNWTSLWEYVHRLQKLGCKAY